MRFTGVARTLLITATLVVMAAAVGPTPASGSGVEGLALPCGAWVIPEGAGALRIEWNGTTVARLRLSLLAPLSLDDHESSPTTPPLPLNGQSSSPLATVTPSPLPNRPAGVAGLQVVARAETIGSIDAVLRSEWYHWPYFQVDDLVIWNLSLLGSGSRALRMDLEPASQPPAGGAIEAESYQGRMELHGPEGDGRVRQLKLPRIRAKDAHGRRLYLGLIDLSGKAQLQTPPEEKGGAWAENLPAQEGARSWILALVTSSSEASFLYNGGQALRMVSLSPEQGPNPRIAKRPFGRRNARVELPPLCYRCRSASIEGSRLRLEKAARGNELRLDLSVGEILGHGSLDGEALELFGHPMAPWWQGPQAADEARYLLPLDSPAARDIIAAAEGGASELELPLNTGIEVDARPMIELDPELLPKKNGAQGDAKLPRKLNPELLEAWPNPFRDRTTIQVKIPTTMGESFFFPEGAPQGFDFSASPPFGRAPAVQVVIYNVGGKLVRTLLRRGSAEGTLQVDWDGKDLMGRPVVAGAYYLDVQIGDYHLTRRILRLRS